MKESLKQLLRQQFPVPLAYFRAVRGTLFYPDSMLRRSGWMASLQAGHPRTEDGRIIPWMNYAIIALLDERLRSDMRLFEYGSGYSTLYYADRVASVLSVEYDSAWFEDISRRVPSNAHILLRPQDVDGTYCRTITERPDARYDLIVVDGRDRVNCVIQSLPHLSDRGVLLLDDSERPRYQPAMDHAASMGFKRLDFNGIKPAGFDMVRTTLFYRADNCLGI
jgi:hypothetical protein